MTPCLSCVFQLWACLAQSTSLKCCFSSQRHCPDFGQSPPSARLGGLAVSLERALIGTHLTPRYHCSLSVGLSLLRSSRFVGITSAAATFLRCPSLHQLGANSGVHIIIFDEIDAICKQRGSMAGSTGVHDTVVNQLLSKIDGVEQLNNILVIGMTALPFSGVGSG